MSLNSQISDFTFQNFTIIGGEVIVKMTRKLVSVSDTLSAIAVGGTNDKLGMILYDQNADIFYIARGTFTMAPIPAISIDAAGQVSFPGGLGPFAGNLDMGGHDILNVNEIDATLVKTVSLTAPGIPNIQVLKGIDMALGTALNTTTVSTDTLTANLNPNIIVSNDLNLNSTSKILNGVEVDTLTLKTDTISVDTAGAITITNQINAGDALFDSVHVNSNGTSSALRIHNNTTSNFCDLTCSNSKNLLVADNNGTDVISVSLAPYLGFITTGVVSHGILTPATYTLFGFTFGTLYSRDWATFGTFQVQYTGTNTQTLFVDLAVSVQATSPAIDDISIAVVLNGVFNVNAELVSSLELKQMGNVGVDNTAYSRIAGSVIFQNNIATGDRIGIMIANNTAARNIDAKFVNFTMRNISAGLDTV